MYLTLSFPIDSKKISSWHDHLNKNDKKLHFYQIVGRIGNIESTTTMGPDYMVIWVVELMLGIEIF